MSQQGQITPPPVIWAQRSDVLYVTICLEDCQDPVLTVSPEKIYFKGVGGTEKKLHEVTINLFKHIDADNHVTSRKDRGIELILPKKESGPFWPRLTEENKKFHWLKSDFNKWQDEEDSEGENAMQNSLNLEEMMRQMGGLGSQGGKPNFDDLDMGDEADGPDSDDDEMPDLE